MRRLFRTNLDANAQLPTRTGKQKEKSSKARSGKSASKKSSASSAGAAPIPNITFTTLDWELDQPELLKGCIETEDSGRAGRRERDGDNDED